MAAPDAPPPRSYRTIGSFALLEKSLRLGGAMPHARKSAFASPYIELIERLVRRRRELGMTQEQLGSAFGEDQSFISRVERCQRRIDVYELVRLCRILRLKPSDLLDAVEEENAAP